MAQRLIIARALMHDPRVLFLDEPTTGLDPQSRLFLWDQMEALRARGVTLLLTTHDMAEADRLCDRIAIVDHGKVIASDTPRGLRRLLPDAEGLELRLAADADPAPALRGARARSSAGGRRRGEWNVRLYGPTSSPARRSPPPRPAARAPRPAPHRGHARGRLRPPDREGPAMNAATPWRAFWALCERDFWVAFRRQLGGFLAQTLLQPLFYLFIFGRVLPEIGAAGQDYGSQLLPGVIALTLFLTALQNTALPLVIEFSFTKEIEDRLLAPLPAARSASRRSSSPRCAGSSAR